LKVIVHIGTEKTGTTSIQKFLYQNRKGLKSSGFHFLQSAGKTNNRALPAYCVSDDRFDDFFRNEGINTPEEREAFRSKFIASFEKELSSLPKKIHTVIISSEHFHSRLRDEGELDSVHKLLSGYFDEFKIVCYLRDQASTCTSYYSTAMKSGNESSFGEFLLRCKPENYYFNYLDFLANWERCFGIEALDVSLFRKDLFLNGDLLDDFTAKIDPQLVGRLNTKVSIENESLTPAGQALARGVNMAFPIRAGRPELRPLRDKCKKNIYEHFTGAGRQPSLITQQNIFSDFAEVNEALRQKFFPEMEEMFQLPSKAAQQNTEVDETFIEGLLGILNIINTSGKRILLKDEYAEVYRNLMVSVSDLAQEELGNAKEGRDAIVSMDDLRLMRLAAGKLEKRDLQTAKSLLMLAQEILPSLPGLSEKLKEYETLSDHSDYPQFVITYSVETEVLAAAENIIVKFDVWLDSLRDCAVGSIVNALRGIHRISNDGSVTATREHMTTGFNIIAVESAEEAYAIAAQLPILEIGGRVEVSAFTSLKAHAE
jgi:hypothetical protein